MLDIAELNIESNGAMDYECYSIHYIWILKQAHSGYNDSFSISNADC